MFHRTKRLLLRPAWPEDWGAILRVVCDEGIVRNLARAPWPYGPAEARAFAAQPQNPRLPHFLVTVPGTGVIGSAGLGEHEGAPEVGYWIAREHWGRGYATEAGHAVLQIARMLGHRKLSAGHFVDNPASGAVLRKLGFVPTGAVRPRASRARGEDVLSVKYELDLDQRADQVPIAA